MLTKIRIDNPVKLHVVTNSIVDNKTPLKNQCLLAFEKNGSEISGNTKNGVYEVSFDDATRNVIVFGATGQGKTESILKPAADRLISSGCAGLILDAKNDYAFLENLYPDLVLRLSLYGQTRINLIGGVEPSVFRTMLEHFSKQYSTSDPYWGMSGVEDALLVFLFYKSLGNSPTLSDIYKALANPHSFCEQLERYLLTTPSISSELQRQIEYRLSDRFSILWIGKFQGNESNSDRTDDQYTWQTNAIKKLLSPFENNPALKTLLCAEDKIDFTSLIYDQGKTLILDINPDVLPDASQIIGQIIRLMFMNCITSNDPTQRKLLGYGEHRYTFMIIDEYQQFINTDPYKHGSCLRDDNSWLDRSRAYGHINILSTQSINSLHARANETTTNTIIQNCQTTICLPTTDSMTLSRISELCGYKDTANEYAYALLHSKSIGKGFIHIANHSQSDHGVLCGMFSAGYLTEPKYHYMSRFLGAVFSMSTITDKTNNDRQVFITNQFRKTLAHVDYLTGNIIFVTTKASPIPNDFLKDILSIKAVKSVEHKFIDDFERLTLEEIEYFDLLVKGDIVIFTNLPRIYAFNNSIFRHNFLDIYKKAVNEGAITLTCPELDSAVEYLREAHMNYSSEEELVDALRMLFSSH